MPKNYNTLVIRRNGTVPYWLIILKIHTECKSCVHGSGAEHNITFILKFCSDLGNTGNSI